MIKYIFTTAILLMSMLLMGQQTHVITQSGMAFDPASITVDVGDTIQWVWTGGTHTTTATTVPDGAVEWNSPLTSSESEFKYKVLVSGTYDYHCIPHQSMGMTGSFTALPVLGINEIDGKAFAFYPNPVRDII